MSSAQLTGVVPSPSVKPPSLWTWTSPDAPIRVNLAFQVISRLRKELEKNASRGEAGGVLLGHVSKVPLALDIQDYVLLPSDAGPAGEYCLNEDHLERLRRKKDDLSVVGYFRTQSEGALHLRKPEIDLVGDHFPNRADVAMLIRTTPHQFRAGFLFWDGDNFVPFSVQDFPFDAAALAGDNVDEHRTVFAPALRPLATTFAAPLEPPVVSAPRAVVRVPGNPKRVHGNVLEICAGVAGLIALSLFLLRDDLPLVSKPAPAAAKTESRATGPASPAPPAVSPSKRPGPVGTPVALRGKLPVPSAPVSSSPSSLSSTSSSRLSGAKTDALASGSRVSRETGPAAGPAPAQPRLAPQRVVRELALPTESAPAPPPPVTLAPPPPLSSREPPPSMPANAAAVIPAVPAPPVASRAVVPATPARYSGSWTYPSTNGLYHGAQPEVVEVVIQELNGRLSGTAYARFKSSSTEPARTLRFQFAGELRAGRTQAFPLETVDGAKGSLELIPGTSPNLLELNFRTVTEGGNAQSGNMVLVKK